MRAATALIAWMTAAVLGWSGPAPASGPPAPPLPAAPTATIETAPDEGPAKGAPRSEAAPAVGEPKAPRPLRARGPRGDASGETWDFAFAFDSGDRLLLRFALTNLGPGERNAAAVWHWVDPDGEVVAYDNGQTESGWSLEEQSQLIRIKSSVLDLRRPLLRAAMDKNRARIEVSMELPPEPVHTAEEGPDHRELWATSAPVTATYWTRGMDSPRALRGRGSLFYSWLRDEGSELRRVDFVSFDPRADAYATAILRETGETEAWAFFRNPDGSTRVTREVVVCPGAGDDYVWPGRIMIQAPATRAVIQVEPPFIQSDPLSALPKAIGVVVGWVYKPMRLWSRATLAVEGSPSPTGGAVRSSFGNPLDKRVRKRLGSDPRCREDPLAAPTR